MTYPSFRSQLKFHLLQEAFPDPAPQCLLLPRSYYSTFCLACVRGYVIGPPVSVLLPYIKVSCTSQIIQIARPSLEDCSSVKRH